MSGAQVAPLIALLQRQIFREQTVSRVNLTRFGEASVNLKHEEQAVDRVRSCVIALDLQRAARWAGWIAPRVAR